MALYRKKGTSQTAEIKGKILGNGWELIETPSPAVVQEPKPTVKKTSRKKSKKEGK